MVAAVGIVVGGPSGIAAASWALSNTAAVVQTAGAAVGAASAIASGAAAGAATGATTATIASVGVSLATGGVGAAASSMAGVTIGAHTAAGGVTAIASGAAATAAAEGVIAASLMAGPIGWAIVGASNYTWDCWKPIVMEKSVEPSLGIRLHQLYDHPNLQEMTLDGADFIAENVRGERFRLSPVEISGVIAFHSTQL